MPPVVHRLTSTVWTMLGGSRVFPARYAGTCLVSGLPFVAGTEVRMAEVNGCMGAVTQSGLRLLDCRTGVTVTEVRLSPDLKPATCFVEPLGAGVDTAPVAGHIDEIIKALNLHAKFLRGALGRHIDMRFTPDLRFRHDESFAAAERRNRLLDDPRVRADVYVSPFEDDDKEDGQP